VRSHEVPPETKIEFSDYTTGRCWFSTAFKSTPRSGYICRMSKCQDSARIEIPAGFAKQASAPLSELIMHCVAN
jgi:hypothetical protein